MLPGQDRDDGGGDHHDEAEHAVDATVARFGPGAVRRAALGGQRRSSSVAEANSVGLFPLA